MKGKKSDIPLETQQSMFIHLSPIDSSCLSFSFVCLHMIIPPPCNFYEASAPHAVTPQGRVSFALFVSRGHFSFSLTGCCFFVCQGCSTRSDYHFNISHRVVWNEICIIDVIKRRGGASKSLRDHQGAPCSQHLNKTNNKKNLHHFCKSHSSVSAHLLPSHGIHFGFKRCHQGLRTKEEEKEKKTLFVRKTKYSYAILNLLCLGCR